MKHIIFKGIFAFAAAVLAISCSKEYLDTFPEDSVSPSTIFSTTENAKMAIRGISRLQTVQYMSNQGYNGEGTIMSHYGNWPGNDLQKCNNTGFDYIINSDAHRPRYVGRFEESLALAMEAGIDPDRIVNIQKR